MSYEIMSLKQPDPPGAVLGFYCAQCRRTTFAWSPYACKPEHGDLFMINMCPDNLLHDFSHPRKIYPLAASLYLGDRRFPGIFGEGATR